MKDELQGRLCQAPNNCVRIDQFLWDPNGVATIEATIDATSGTKVVFSYSEGARSVTDWLAKHADDPDAPPPAELSFVVIGNPTRAYGGADSDVMPQTQYQIIDISRQYDFASDFPDNPANLLTLLNSLMAFTIIHTEYEDVDMYDPANIVWTEGNTTYVFVPTENLPLLEPLRRLGFRALADALNAPLKEIVERGYDRSYLPAVEKQAADVAGLSVPVPSDTAARADGNTEGLHDADPDGAGEFNADALASHAEDGAPGDDDPVAGDGAIDDGIEGADEPVVRSVGANEPAGAPGGGGHAESIVDENTTDETTDRDDPEAEDAATEGQDREADGPSDDGDDA
ncbi:hypothetical protein FHR72_004590 [Mycolicibacterium iranicum]|uniref:PE-PPE domain-containing protein n=1 Tax=Mycolicibacterium iranicum TaxID=912594 RepID=A0A839QBX2_MYCIR|nr:PE-PPE domain-containing protein [Mycolicibacterium iranicum]MBB2993083.1 hypothetical protein [Mycolicibacterium iranicum]